jgi:hypothetical protein
MLNDMLTAPDLSLDDSPENGPPPEVDVPEAFQVVIECRDEAQQQAVFQRLTAEGLKCRLLTL